MEAERAHTRPEPARCLVIGGGLLGSHVARELVSSGHAVSVYSRSFSDWLLAERELGLEVELVPGEVPPAVGLDELVGDADVVFFLAGSSTPRLSEEDAVGSILGSLTPALSVMESLRRAKGTRIVIASSGGTVYGPGSKLPTSEDAPTRPISLHGVNSLAIEGYAAFYAREHGVRPLILRYSNVFGPGERVHFQQAVVATWCDALSRGLPLTIIGDGSVERDFLFAKDAAVATVKAAFTTAGPAVYNVGSGRSHSLREILDTLVQISGLTPEVRHVPASPIDVPITRLDSSRLREATGWSVSTDFADGLAASWAWALRRNSDAAGEDVFSDQPAGERPTS
jgi:UDP-glucose 4-epimerase